MSYAPRTTLDGPTAEKTEPTGPIAADSLAADSLRSSGDFAANDPSHPEPMGVKGSSSTLANTDTSGAIPLHAASSGAEREREDEKGLGSDEKGDAGGVKYPDAVADAGQGFPGTTTSEGYSGGPSSARQGGGYDTGAAAGGSDFGASTMGGTSSGGSTGMSGSGGGADETSATGGLPSTEGSAGSASVPTGTGTSTETSTKSSSGPDTGAGVRPYVPEGPTYTGRVAGTIGSEEDQKPKGTNLTEGDVPATKTFLGDVGGPNDPGRLAEREFAKVNADVAGAGVSGSRAEGDAEGKTGSGGYDVLSSERA